MRRGTAILLVLGLVLFGLPAAAFAHTTQSVAETGGMTITLPGLGSGLTIEVVLDDHGNIDEVNLDPADGYESESDDPHRMRIEHDMDVTRINIKAWNLHLATQIQAATLAELVGTNTWESDVFGTGEPYIVSFDIADVSGNPELSNVVVNDGPADAMFEVGTVDNEADADEARSTVKVEFEMDGVKKTLTIDVRLSFDPEEDRPVTLRISLKGKDQSKLRASLDELVGSYLWTGLLCDATPVSVPYEVTTEGTLVIGAVEGDHTLTQPHDKMVQIRFVDSKVRVKIQLVEKDNETYELSVKSRADKCKDSHENGRPEKDKAKD